MLPHSGNTSENQRYFQASYLNSKSRLKWDDLNFKPREIKKNRNENMKFQNWNLVKFKTSVDYFEASFFDFCRFRFEVKLKKVSVFKNMSKPYFPIK